MFRPRQLLIAIAVVALAACGQKGDLKRPLSAKSVPIPYGREVPPTTAALMKPPVQASPERNVELLTKSETRPDDPFNLPPKE